MGRPALVLERVWRPGVPRSTAALCVAFFPSAPPGGGGCVSCCRASSSSGPREMWRKGAGSVLALCSGKFPDAACSTSADSLWARAFSQAPPSRWRSQRPPPLFGGGHARFPFHQACVTYTGDSLACKAYNTLSVRSFPSHRCVCEGCGSTRSSVSTAIRGGC